MTNSQDQSPLSKSPSFDKDKVNIYDMEGKMRKKHGLKEASNYDSSSDSSDYDNSFSSVDIS